MRKLFLTLIILLSLLIFQEKPYSADEMDFDTTVSSNEIEDFLEVWYLYNKQGMYEHKYKTSQKDMSLDYSPKITKWLAKHKWQVDRFFYCEKRLQDILKAKELRDLYTDSKPMLEGQIITEEQKGRYANKSLIKALRDNIKDMSKAPYDAGVTDEEIDLVGANYQYITSYIS